MWYNSFGKGGSAVTKEVWDVITVQKLKVECGLDQTTVLSQQHRKTEKYLYHILETEEEWSFWACLPSVLKDR